MTRTSHSGADAAKREACLLCGSAEASPFVVGRDRLLDRRSPHTIVRCSQCGFRYLSPRPDAAGLEEAYPDAEYEPYHTRHSKPTDKAATAGLRGLKWRLDAARLRSKGYDLEKLPQARPVERILLPFRRDRYRYSVLSPRGRCRMLEIGCGTGNLLYRHRDLGWETTGVEMSERAASRAREVGLDVRSQRVEDAELPKGHFDLVVLNHVLEHLEDPLAILRQIREYLAPSGQVMIEVPNPESFGARLFGSYWFPLELPRHLFHFTLEDLRRLAHATGYRIAESMALNVGDELDRSIDYWLEDRRWLPEKVRKRRTAYRLKVQRRLRYVISLLQGRHRGEATRVWLEAR